VCVSRPSVKHQGAGLTYDLGGEGIRDGSDENGNNAGGLHFV